MLFKFIENNQSVRLLFLVDNLRR